jgi:UPF0755 protein
LFRAESSLVDGARIASPNENAPSDRQLEQQAFRARYSTVRKIVIATVVLAVGAVGWLCHFAVQPLTIPESARQFRVEQGASLRSVARQLSASGVLHEWVSFVALVRILGKSGAVKAGIYDLPDGITPYGLIGKFSRGEVSFSEITFIEGWTFGQLRAALNAEPTVRHDTAGLTDEELLQRLKVPERHPEGLFFPDTYRFATGASDFQILERAYRTMEARLANAWEHRAPGLPFRSEYDALILASIVEKETGRPEDRRMIAAVFANRLKRGMRLQTDPSVIYGMGATFDGNLRKRDLEADGPYNTYTRAGLPPTPIALPGQAALDAVTDPAQSNALYFVSRGDGTSEFSSTLEQHNRAVQKYQLKH